MKENFTEEELEILATLLDFGEEHWHALGDRYSERTGEILPAAAYDRLKEKFQ